MWMDAYHVFTDAGHALAEVAYELLFTLLGMFINWLMIRYRESKRDKEHGHQ